MAFVGENEDLGGKLSLISTKSGGNILENKNISKNISKSEGNDLILRLAARGTPLIELGKGYPKVMIVSGVHGNELPPQIAALNLLEKIQHCKLRGTVYMIPFAAPGATMKNSRWFNGLDLNRSSSSKGSITNNIVQLIQMLNVDAVADFHSTKLCSNPGKESVFCSKNPCPQSHEMGIYITENTSSELICYSTAGSMYNGALEDECNIKGIPAITCEVVSENGEVTVGSPERSYLQMQSYLEHFKILR
ncbi:succinylglutamate desuccinylase/aspartoacylase domain-containing protein [Methanobacterium alcaliphilum]|uniref:succinylglutamate desuccinylase/aspartoacylase domain-containing protein n=1 Tax=Methanobacterium alcaliphilum TaxID=392018 RepID=UPI00200B8430|nr:succinylglutamate desuccinylase/aspartoacylase family protein [Methanobacterium alcaliphilum]MCK9151436.1 succinylglutamate desuccinylase/aspartoacylase family protein [Methanobacterium alcaliphilum]